VLRKVFATSTTSVSFLKRETQRQQRETQRQVWRNNVTRSDNRNTKLQVWLSKEDFEKLEQFLDKFSAGDDFSDQLSARLRKEKTE
jgi:hypothetical protein